MIELILTTVIFLISTFAMAKYKWFERAEETKPFLYALTGLFFVFCAFVSAALTLAYAFLLFSGV